MFARKQVIFKPPKKCSISFNYQYDVMKSIYYYTTVADEVKGRFLHNEGYRAESGHVYKLFTYALLFENVEFGEKTIDINENSTLKLIVSGKKDIVSLILKGLLHIKKLKIEDIEFKLSNIEDDKKVNFQEIMLYKALNPIIETTLDNDKNKVYLSPYQGDYYKNLAYNVMRKYELVYNAKYNNQIFFDIDEALNIKEKIFNFKEGSLKGYQYDIWVEASPKMQKIIYYLGLGQNNSSLGAGTLSYITGRRGKGE